MINMGTEKIRLEDDGWTFVTQDGLVSAHFEHNSTIINGEPEILSTFDFIYDELGIDSNEEINLKFLINEVYFEISAKKIFNKT